VETHRLSCSGPNLLNIPKNLPLPDPDAPTDRDEQMQWEYDNLNIKSMYISRFEGGVLMEADFGQAELRIAAQESGDVAMLAAFREGRDIHKETAALIAEVPLVAVTKGMRQRAKAINFGIIYGQGDKALGQAIGASKQGAADYRAEYFKVFHGLKAHIDRGLERIKDTLMVTSIFGFERHFVEPEEKTTGDRDRWNQWSGWRVQRQVLNTEVQGAAACVTYVAIIEMEKRMRELDMRSIMVNTVYDSILFDVYPGEQDSLARLAKEVMENPPTEQYGVTLTVPMAVDIEVGKTWGDQKPLDMGE
jgi:DNA polymerase-1